MNQVFRGFSQLLAFFFHPLFVIVYVLMLFLVINPYLFPYRHGREFGAILLIVAFTTIVIPAISILLMYGTDLIKSIKLDDSKDRIGPLIVTAVSYLWLFLNIRTHSAIPPIFSAFVLGALISICIAFFLNNFHKISLHAVGMGGMLAALIHLLWINGRSYTQFTFFQSFNISIHNLFVIVILVIISGSVLSSRLYLKAHNLQDVLGGALVGIVGQIFALKFF